MTTRSDPPLPDSRNAGRRHAHWSVVYRRTQAYYAACERCTVGVEWPQWEAVVASAVVYPRGSNDEGNLLARLAARRLIVRKGLVPSDKPKHWHWSAIPSRSSSARTPPGWNSLLTQSTEHGRKAA